ncbi:MAG: DUF1080 domain-containing protein [Planctomycetales bacterium]|nr:DUF1080 domain-containing protein [Planctomycetales bacterium]
MNRLPRIIVNCGLTVIVLVASAFESSSCNAQQPTPAETATAKPAGAEKKTEPTEKTAWVTLQGNWKTCQFGGDGDVTINDGVIKLEYGDPLTGVRWGGPFDGKKSEDADTASDAQAGESQPLPRDNYEVRWECRRDKGFDFLCAFTFPVAEQHASLVMGGWGGGITGISSIDGRDASDNETTMFKNYDDKKWYKARVRVETEKITVWIDGKEMFDQPRKDHEFDIRFEMDPCTPLGIANFECDSQIRNIQIRRLDPTEIAPSKKDEK